MAYIEQRQSAVIRPEARVDLSIIVKKRVRMETKTEIWHGLEIIHGKRIQI